MTIFRAGLRAHQHEDVRARAQVFLDVGFEGLGLWAPFHAHDWSILQPILPREALASVDLFLPYPRGVRPGFPPPLRIGAPDPEHKHDAVRFGKETILFAEKNSVQFVRIPPVRLDVDLRGPCGRLREQGNLARLLPFLQASRRSEVVPRLDAFRSVLSRLLDAAARQGVRIAIVPSGWLDEFPGAAEAEALLSEFRGAPLSVWLDTLHRARALELEPSAEQIWDRLARSDGARSPTSPGFLIRDRDGENRPVLPGMGDPRCGGIEWKALRPVLGTFAAWWIDPPSGATAEDLSDCREFLAALLHGSPDAPPTEPYAGLFRPHEGPGEGR